MMLMMMIIMMMGKKDDGDDNDDDDDDDDHHHHHHHLIYIVQFDNNGILEALYIAIKYIQTQYNMHMSVCLWVCLNRLADVLMRRLKLLLLVLYMGAAASLAWFCLLVLRYIPLSIGQSLPLNHVCFNVILFAFFLSVSTMMMMMKMKKKKKKKKKVMMMTKI